MSRKLALLLAVGLGFWHGAAHALGLGEISVDSALNQRFEARIDLRNTENLGPNEIIAALASPEDFERVGVERFFFLSDLQFSTDLSDPSNPTLIVTSNQPITEPFVNFVVEVMWPAGRLLREYTVLLDPPAYAAGAASPPRTPPTATDGGPRPPRPGRPDTVAVPSTPEAVPSGGTGRGELSGSTYGVTDREDTLWEVALTVRPEPSLSVQQTMLALVRTNPEAFIGNNINQLKAGYVLRVPDAAEIRRLSFDDAMIQVAQQNERWRSGLDRAPLDAREETAGPRPAGAASDGELRLVSAEEDGARSSQAQAAGGSGGASAPGTDARGSGASVAELSEARAAAEALREQLEATESRAADLARELELKNEQLARAQQALAEEMNAPAPPAPAPAPAPGLFGFGWPLIAGLLALVGLVAAVLVVLRRRGGGDEPAIRPRAPAGDAGRTEPVMTLGDGAAAAATGGAVSAASAARDDVDEAEDVIGEADVYMVYGRFSEAARVLDAAIDQDPDRTDLRLKLLEVCVESGDVDTFNVHAQALSAFADNETIALADQLATRLPGAMSSTGDVTDGVVATAPAPDLADGEVSLDFDLAAAADGGDPLDLDSLDIDFDLDGTAANRSDGAPVPTDADRDTGAALDTEFDLDMADDGDLPSIDYDLDLGSAQDGDEDVPAAPGAAPAESDPVESDPVESDPVESDLVESNPVESAPGVDELDEATFGGVAFEQVDGPEQAGVAEAAADTDAFAKTQLLDSALVQQALHDGDTTGSDGERDPDGLSRDDYAFDIDDLSGEPAEEGAAGGIAAANEDFELDDLTDAAIVGSAANDDAAGDADGETGTSMEVAPEFAGELAGDAVAEAAPGERTDDAGLLDAGSVGEDDRSIPAASEGDLDFDLDGEEFDFGGADEGDEISTKLELARAYVDMGDEDGAREILGEVVRDGDDTQKQEAGDLLQQIG